MVAPVGKVKCPSVTIQKYKGKIVRYHKPVRVNPDFQARLVRFEEVVKKLGVKYFGRAPKRIVHLGSYYCRRIRSYPTYVSEHGLGNALDVAGFDFPRTKSRSVARKLRGPQRVRLLKHWGVGKKPRGVRKVYADFLEELARETVRLKIFRVNLGPAYPGHKNHFHFDMSPWEIVEIWPEDLDEK